LLSHALVLHIRRQGGNLLPEILQRPAPDGAIILGTSPGNLALPENDFSDAIRGPHY
jgi:hypothetical protein